MSAFTSANMEPVSSKNDLVTYFEAGSKPKTAWKVGTEHEQFAYRLSDFSPLPYENGIQNILNDMTLHGWIPVYEGGNIIALTNETGASISLEPGGQVELSGAPFDSVHQTFTELSAYRNQVCQVATKNEAALLGLGFHPRARREDFFWMPKERYRIMRAYMPKRGSSGIDMMLRTCTIQANLDYGSESDMVVKMRVSVALQPIITALFANSPLLEGKPSGFLSYRARIWEDTDPDRCGMPEFVFEDGFGFERWVDYLLDIPMYFVHRQNTFLDASGRSFRDFMEGKLSLVPGQKPTAGDWSDHLSTAFPDVRLKRYIEVRGADGGPWDRLCSLPALWVGLLYDSDALQAAWDLVKKWTPEDRRQLHADVPRRALKARIASRPVHDIARDILDIAHHGLSRRARLDLNGADETIFLAPLHALIESGKTPAENILSTLETRWKGDITSLFTEGPPSL